ncbi:hypothetical protein ACJJIR_15400 [Microbulbifer sp. SSSA008]|uniref:hypothetical protein n=1 Tax=Microbulbifer sp. SSSA008 TaxID=3243380 RepID=UPI004039D748
MEIFEIADEISEASVTDAIIALNNAYDQEEIKILLPYNSGGSVGAAIDLIKAIAATKADVIVELDRYAISAAAFIWVWFFLRPESHIKVQTTGQPAVIVYHRPRVPVEDHLLFLDDLPDGHELRASLQESTSLFDELFDELIAAVGYISDNENIYTYNEVLIKHKLKHARDGYYINQDCVIPA